MTYFYFIIGTILASFATLCAVRIPQHRSIRVPRSHCDNCQHQLAWWQLIPIIGFVSQRGRCHYCHARINPISTLNECLCGWWFLQCAAFPAGPMLGYDCIFLTLILLSTLDAYYTFVYPLCFLGLLPLFWLLPHPAYMTLSYWLGLIILTSILLMLFARQQLGLADVEIMIILLMIFDLYTVSVILFISSSLALSYALITHQKERFAFLPFLCFALVAVLTFHLHFV